MTNQRPTSPHLKIYRLPLTAKLSISHRITGVFLSLGLVVTVLFLTALAYGPSTWDLVHEFLLGTVGQVILFSFTLVLNFHLCNGIRHLFWDMGQGFSLPAAARSNFLVLAMTLVLTVVVWIVALAV